MNSAIMKRFGRKSHEWIMRDPRHDKRVSLLEGAVRSSKTFAVDAKTIVQYCRYPLPLNAKRFMTGATKQTFYRNVLLDLANIAGKENFSYNAATGECWLFGTQWFVIGAKDEASYRQVLGSTCGLWIGDEVVEYPSSFIAQMLMRMSLDESRAALTTNPGTPFCYLKTDVIDNPAMAGQLEVRHYTLDDNPNISDAAKAQIIASQVGVYRLRYIDGLWVVAEGSIFRDAWSDEENTYAETARLSDNGKFRHKARPVGLRGAGGHVDHWFSCDPGVDHPHVYCELYDDGDVVWLDRVWRWDSRKEMRQLTDSQYADKLIEFMGGEPKYEVRLPPEAASFRAELQSRGFYVLPADNSVSEGIHTISTLLSKRKLRVNVDQCQGMEKRILAYAWDPKAAKLGEESPLKKDDDDIDSLRYGIFGKIPMWRVTGG